MAQINLNDAIRQAVEEEVARVLGPQLDAFRKLADAFSAFGAPGRRGPAAAPARAGRPPAAAARRRGPGRPRKAGGGGKGDASKFQVGQAVRYKQGRGEFSSTVVSVDAAAGMLTLKRDKDGKQIHRPAAKVY